MGDEEAPKYTQLTPAEEVRVVAIELALSYTCNQNPNSFGSLRAVMEAARGFEQFILNGKKAE